MAVESAGRVPHPQSVAQGPRPTNATHRTLSSCGQCRTEGRLTRTCARMLCTQFAAVDTVLSVEERWSRTTRPWTEPQGARGRGNGFPPPLESRQRRAGATRMLACCGVALID